MFIRRRPQGNGEAKRRAAIEKRIAVFESRRPRMSVVDKHNGDVRPASAAEKERAEYVIDKQLKRARRELENHDAREAKRKPSRHLHSPEGDEGDV